MLAYIWYPTGMGLRVGLLIKQQVQFGCRAAGIPGGWVVISSDGIGNSPVLRVRVG